MDMFGDYTKKNRRFTSREFYEELDDARTWRRRPRHYIRDKPDYGLETIEPLVNFSPCVNFQLNFKF